MYFSFLLGSRKLLRSGFVFLCNPKRKCNQCKYSSCFSSCVQSNNKKGNYEQTVVLVNIAHAGKHNAKTDLMKLYSLYFYEKDIL